MGSEKDGMKRSIKSLLASIFVSLFPVASAVAGPYEDGVAAYERGDYAKAVELFRKAAEQGDAYAQYNLGQMYDKGKGVKQDYVETHKWVSLAAAQGLKKAIENREMVASQLTPAQMTEAQRLAREWKSKK
jgi:TPR repeat protein